MKMIKFDATNSRMLRFGESVIRFARQGQITLSKKFVEDAKLKKGTKISVVQDEDKPEDWYLVVNDPDGFELRFYDEGNAACNNAYIAKTFLDCMNEENAKSGGCKISTEPVKDDELPKGAVMYAIITASLICTQMDNEENDEQD